MNCSGPFRSSVAVSAPPGHACGRPRLRKRPRYCGISESEETSPCRRGSFRHSTESSVRPAAGLYLARAVRSEPQRGECLSLMALITHSSSMLPRLSTRCVHYGTMRRSRPNSPPLPRDSAQVLGRAGRNETVTSLFCADRRSWGDRPPRPSPCFVTDRGRISVRYPCCRTKLVRPAFTGAVALGARGGELLHSGPRDESMSGLCALHKPETGCNRGLSQ